MGSNNRNFQWRQLVLFWSSAIKSSRYDWKSNLETFWFNFTLEAPPFVPTNQDLASSLNLFVAKCWCALFSGTRTWSLKTGSYQKLSVFLGFMAGAPKDGCEDGMGIPFWVDFLRKFWTSTPPSTWFFPQKKGVRLRFDVIFRCSCWTLKHPSKTDSRYSAFSASASRGGCFGSGGKSGRLRHDTKLEIWDLEVAHFL